MLAEKTDLFSQVGFLLDDGADYVGIINKNGRIENATCKNDINLTTEKREMFYMGIRLQNCMQGDFDEDLGTVNYILVERENSKFFSVPFSSFTVLAIMDKRMDHITIINKIKTLMTNSTNIKQELLVMGSRSS
jgi:hypothetical protein